MVRFFVTSYLLSGGIQRPGFVLGCLLPPLKVCTKAWSGVSENTQMGYTGLFSFFNSGLLYEGITDSLGCVSELGNPGSTALYC